MRENIRRVSSVKAVAPRHLGLAYDMWAPVDAAGDQVGKVNDKIRKDWLEGLANLEIAPEYAIAFQRWQASLNALGAFSIHIRAVSRLLIGHGNPSGTEVGLTVQHTWGAPVIPASSLKGVLQHHLVAKYGPDVDQWNHHPLDENHPQAAHAAFQPAHWDARLIVHSPGRAIRAIFGAPEANSDRQWADQGGAEDVGAVKGNIHFHDAWWYTRQDRSKPFAVDLLNVHQRHYYGQAGRRHWPNDYDSPVPIHFMTVRPGQRFLLAVSGEEALARWVLGELVEALCERGVGGKTSAGYGMFEAEGEIIKPKIEVPSSPVLESLLGLLSQTSFPAGLSKDSGQREHLAYITEHWVVDLMQLTPDQRAFAAEELRKSKLGKHPKLKADVRKLADDLCS